MYASRPYSTALSMPSAVWVASCAATSRSSASNAGRSVRRSSTAAPMTRRRPRSGARIARCPPGIVGRRRAAPASAARGRRGVGEQRADPAQHLRQRTVYPHPGGLRRTAQLGRLQQRQPGRGARRRRAPGTRWPPPGSGRSGAAAARAARPAARHRRAAGRAGRPGSRRRRSAPPTGTARARSRPGRCRARCAGWPHRRSAAARSRSPRRRSVPRSVSGRRRASASPRRSPNRSCRVVACRAPPSPAAPPGSRRAGPAAPPVRARRCRRPARAGERPHRSGRLSPRPPAWGRGAPSRLRFHPYPSVPPQATCATGQVSRRQCRKSCSSGATWVLAGAYA